MNELTGKVIESAIKIHSAVGPGCFERVYEEILFCELYKQGLEIERQVLLPIEYESLYIKDAFKVDLIIEDCLILEIKSVEHIMPVHFKQLMTYLNLMELKNGMLLNFKSELMKNGIYRVFNNFGD